MIPGSLGRRGGLRQIIVAAAALTLVPAMLAAQRALSRNIRGSVSDSNGARVAYSNVLLDNKRPIVSEIRDASA